MQCCIRFDAATYATGLKPFFGPAGLPLGARHAGHHQLVGSSPPSICNFARLLRICSPITASCPRKPSSRTHACFVESAAWQRRRATPQLGNCYQWVHSHTTFCMFIPFDMSHCNGEEFCDAMATRHHSCCCSTMSEIEAAVPDVGYEAAVGLKPSEEASAAAKP